MTVLIDTDVLIDHLRGVPDAQDFLLRLESDVSCPAISVISVAEIEAGVRDSERPLVEHLFAAMQVYDVDKSIARQAGRYRAFFGRSHGVQLPDALIAATAKVHRFDLITLNVKHYSMEDIVVRVPYGKG